ncbi:M24 family metallopeptidase [Catellicoccus marimammalium]|uniref:Proline dipeptidase n=1 Tax=Catellicoccus marimammalium M35/04/3 TaxID=1234409 RepID=K8Z993_9ENTE|nr:Xaa-Pro peptidase family protein [Catellicoccus marimammalium]EKU27445.1 Proline dipeptidase [Catellicoccus marimammalium M35/04/3]
MNQQLKEVQNWLKENQLEAAYIHAPSDIAYFTNFHSDPHERVLALFIFPDQEPFLFTPALEVESAEQVVNFPVYGYLDSENPWTIISEQLKNRGVQSRIAIQKDVFPVNRWEALKEALPTLTEAMDVSPLIQRMHLCKSQEEIAIMMEAGKWADFAFEKGFSALQEGVSEQEVAAYLEYELKKQGVHHMSFDTIVLFGAHAASPHGMPDTEHHLENHQLALFDLGCMWNGYASDATRMACYGEPTDRQREIFDIVYEAQRRAQEAIRPGVTAGELDAIARDYITSKGYGEYFTHRLGHGIGQQCHEFPSIVGGNDMVIEEGMCFSIEPGIYIPNEIGVRVEDCVHVTKDGSEAFTKLPKELYIIKD